VSVDAHHLCLSTALCVHADDRVWTARYICGGVTDDDICLVKRRGTCLVKRLSPTPHVPTGVHDICHAGL